MQKTRSKALISYKTLFLALIIDIKIIVVAISFLANKVWCINEQKILSYYYYNK